MNFRAILISHVEAIAHLLPLQLKERCFLWVNFSLVYGRNELGRGLTFHPDSGWLVRQGCHKEKGGGVELYSPKDYLEDFALWGYEHAFFSASF